MYRCTHVVRYVIVCTGLCVVVIVHTHMYGCTHVVSHNVYRIVCGGYCLQLRLYVYRAVLSDTMRNQDKKVCSWVFVCIRMCSGMCACVHVRSVHVHVCHAYAMVRCMSHVCHMYVSCMYTQPFSMVPTLYMLMYVFMLCYCVM